MGDILGAVFGSGNRTSQTTTPDPTTQALNNLRYQQLEYLFNGPGGRPFGSYQNERPDVYTPSQSIADLYGLGTDAYTLGRERGSAATSAASAGVNEALVGTEGNINSILQGLSNLYGISPQGNAASTSAALQPFTEGVGAVNSRLYGDTDRILAEYGQGIQSANQTLSGINGINASPVDYSNLMSLQDYTNLGLNQASNYISQIATPQILSQAALAGLEGGGVVPEAIAKATAEIGLPFVQSLPGASTALTLAPQQAELIRKQREAADVQRQLGLSGQYASNLGQLAGLQTGVGTQRAAQTNQALLGLGEQQLQVGNLGLGYGNLGLGYGGLNLSALGQAGQLGLGLGNLQSSQLLGVGGLLNQNALGFAGLGPQTAQTLLPLADYSRGLREQDLLRQQGVSTSGLTGLPYTPGGTVKGKEGSQPLFNFFGQG